MFPFSDVGGCVLLFLSCCVVCVVHSSSQFMDGAFMINRRVYKFFSVLLAVSLAGLNAAEVFAQPCRGCHVPANPKNRNPERREDRPDLLPKTDPRDSSVRPLQMPEMAAPRAAPASSPRVVIELDDPSRDARNGSISR